MKILVAGGAGFLGVNLVKRLLEQEHQVIVVDNLSTGVSNNLKTIYAHKGLKFIQHDIIHPLSIVEHINQIYNLACPASPKHYQIDPVQTTKTSVLGTLNLLELAKIHNARLLQCSTSEIYGDPLEHPQRESYWGNVNPVGIRACYDEGKRCAESLCFDYWRQYRVIVKVARIFNTYGPYMQPQDGRMVSNFIVAALYGQPLTIYGDGNQTRSLCYVDDLINGFITFMNSDSSLTGPINFGNQTELTVNEIAQKILLLSGSSSAVVYSQLPEDDPKRRCPDITAAKGLLNWLPHVSLDEGLSYTINYFRSILKPVAKSFVKLWYETI